MEINKKGVRQVFGSKNVTRKLILLSVIVCVVVGIFGYQWSRPTITIHTEFESGYLGKVSEIDGNTVRLIVDNNKVSYRLPHTWLWKDDDEIAIFTPHYNDIFRKENIDFRHLDIYLDEHGKYKSHTKRKSFW